MTTNNLIFRIADPDDLEGILRFQHFVYARDLGRIPDDAGAASAHYFVALTPTSAIVASFRLIGPDSRPFDIESSVDLDKLLGPNARPALVGRLCVHPAHRKATESIFIHRGLLRLVLGYASDRQITDLLLYAYSNLQRFYRAARFDDTGVGVTHPDWGPVHLMRRHLAVKPVGS